ncbi:related to Dityrosine transporter 1 [Saccharomycodes ludwigii]|uniref:Related to Dityrosine transporter 1 n=2 Tax=Saccharomycodes ludwigii TaxID=36035 RepID=A0A376B7N0_9ASCO|nr:related to Dityrosine transporter 1 [Saccharomycodes ludwigii]
MTELNNNNNNNSNNDNDFDRNSSINNMIILTTPTKNDINRVTLQDIEKELSSTSSVPSSAYSVFSKRQKQIIFSVIIYCGFLGPVSGNIYIPALPYLRNAFHVNTTTINSTVSVFMAVFSVAPLCWAMFSDFGGRKFLYTISLIISIIANILLAAVPANIGALFVLRIIQAIGSSSVMSMGAGTVRDIVDLRHRGKAISYFMLGPNCGPILAPIIAGLILMRGSDKWRWLFGSLTIFTFIGLLMVLLLLPETLRCIVGNGDKKWIQDPHIQRKNQNKLLYYLGRRLPVNQSPEFQELYPRPPKPSLKTYYTLLKNPRVTICSISTAIMFAIYYGFSITFSYNLQNYYHLSNLAVSASYCCPGIALLAGSISSGHISDFYRQRWLKRHPNVKSFPSERRLILQIFGLIISCCGCIGYGWSIERHKKLIIVYVFSCLCAFGMTWCSNASLTYLTETMPRQAASTVAINSFFRNIAAALSSVIIHKLTVEMGVGWCFTGLGLSALISVVGVLYLIIRYKTPSVCEK